MLNNVLKPILRDILSDILEVEGAVSDTISMIKYADADVDVDIILSIPADYTVYINWGDGNTSSVIGPQAYTTYNHVYADTGSDYQITIYGDITAITAFHIEDEDPFRFNISELEKCINLMSISIAGGQVSGDIIAFASLPLELLILIDTTIYGNVAVLSGLTDLWYIGIINSNITGDVSSLQTLTSATVLGITETDIDGFINSLTSLTLLTALDLSDTDVTYASTTLPTEWDDCTIYLDNCGLPSHLVSAFLIDLDTASTASTEELKIGGTNEYPTTAGLAAAYSLITKGWTVSHTFDPNNSLQFTKYADADVDIDIILSLPAGEVVYIDWGDGNISRAVGPQSATTYSNTYASAVEDYTITIYGNVKSLTYINAAAQPVSGNITGCSSLQDIQFIRFYNTLISGDVAACLSVMSDIAYMHFNSSNVSGDMSLFDESTTITNMYFANTNVDGSLNGYGALTSMVYIDFINTSIVCDVSNLSPLVNLTHLRLAGCTGVSYTSTTLPTAWDNTYIRLDSCDLSQTEVDNFLCDLDTASVASTKSLNISGTNAAPSATGLACKTSLEGKGWTVTVTV